MLSKKESAMKELQEYVNRKNALAKIFGDKPLSLANAKDRQKIAENIDCELSPENISCDGELPRSQVQARYRLLSRAGAQLLKLDSSVKIWELSY